MSKRNRRNRRNRPRQSNEKNTHHLLYQGRHWKQGYAKLLRESPYFKALIPRDTLHRAIHSRVETVPVPDGVSAKVVYDELAKLFVEGVIHDSDTIERKLIIAIKLFSKLSPLTAEALSGQLRIFNSWRDGQ